MFLLPHHSKHWYDSCQSGLQTLGDFTCPSPLLSLFVVTFSYQPHTSFFAYILLYFSFRLFMCFSFVHICFVMNYYFLIERLFLYNIFQLWFLLPKLLVAPHTFSPTKIHTLSCCLSWKNRHLEKENKIKYKQTNQNKTKETNI